jgi:5-(hydroxymethyl)furfural/furfural oxidase
LADRQPCVLKLDTELDFDGPLHDRRGPIGISRIARKAMSEFGRATGEALLVTGLPFLKDQRGEFDDGISRRCSIAATAPLPERRLISTERSNLTTGADSEVEQLQIDRRCAMGVPVSRSKKRSPVTHRQRAALLRCPSQREAVLR